MKCDNIERNCQWEGTVGTLEAHVTTCEFTLLPCPKKCIRKLMRMHLDEHVEKECPKRDHQCEHCGKKDRYAFIAWIHDRVCKMKIIPCSNESAGCTKTMPRQDIEKHKLECEYTVIACKFKIIGCTTEMKRGDMAAHEQDDSFHFRYALNTIVKINTKITRLESETRELKENVLTLESEINMNIKSSMSTTVELKDGGPFMFKLGGFQEKKERSKRFTSPSFYTNPCGYHVVICVDANGSSAGHVTVTAPILQGKYDATLKWPLTGKVTVTLLNQLKDNKHHQKASILAVGDDARVGSSFSFLQFVHHSKLSHNSVRNTQYLEDDTLYFRVSVDIPDHKPWLECTM